MFNQENIGLTCEAIVQFYVNAVTPGQFKIGCDNIFISNLIYFEFYNLKEKNYTYCYIAQYVCSGQELRFNEFCNLHLVHANSCQLKF